MFDYDGTLTPIVQDPAAAIPTDEIRDTIRRLASDTRNTVWIISGRDQVFLDRWMGDIPQLGLSAEHGSFVREPRSAQWRNLAEQADMGWQSEVMDVFEKYTKQTKGNLYIYAYPVLSIILAIVPFVIFVPRSSMIDVSSLFIDFKQDHSLNESASR